MRRVPDPDSPRWTHVCLYLSGKDGRGGGVWMEEFKFLAAYKLKPTVSLSYYYYYYYYYYYCIGYGRIQTKISSNDI